jgi:hypothetical protein
MRIAELGDSGYEMKAKCDILGIIAGFLWLGERKDGC